jgi:hypothetical protein
MKRLVTGLLLASVLLVAGVVSASAVSIYQDKNATLLINADGTNAWLFVMNAGTAPFNALSISLYEVANIDSAGSYVYKADGTLVSLALTADDARGFDWVAASSGRLIRCWLPVQVLPYEYVIVKIDQAAPAAIKVFETYFGTIGN